MSQLQDSLDSTKSPGSPFCYYAPTNHSLMTSHFPEWLEEVESMTAKLIAYGQHLHNIRLSDRAAFEQALGCGPDRAEFDAHCVALLRSGITHPTLLKVKGEPRRLGKRPRLVCMVSNVVNTCMRLILGNHLIEEQTHRDLATATQLDITTPSETASLFREFQSHAPLVSNDVQGWEYSTSPQLHYHSFAMYCVRMNLVDKDHMPREHKLRHYFALLGLFSASIHRVLQTSNGQLLTSTPGGTSSGELFTFSKNSIARTSLNDQVVKYLGMELSYNKAAGDDNLDASIPAQNPVETLKSAYKHFGVVITDVAIQTESFNFCSTIFNPMVSYQENISKAFANLIFTTKKDDIVGLSEKLTGFEASFRNHPEYHLYCEWIASHFG